MKKLIFLSLLLSILFACLWMGYREKPSVSADFSIIRDIAERASSDKDDKPAYRELDKIIYSANNPAELADTIIKIRECTTVNPHKYKCYTRAGEGRCHVCDRYGNALYSCMERLSQIQTDEAAEQIVRLLTVENCHWDAHPGEMLEYYIIKTGNRALPYLDKLGNHYPAKSLAKAIREGKNIF